MLVWSPAEHAADGSKELVILNNETLCVDFTFCKIDFFMPGRELGDSKQCSNQSNVWGNVSRILQGTCSHPLPQATKYPSAAQHISGVWCEVPTSQSVSMSHLGLGCVYYQEIKCSPVPRKNSSSFSSLAGHSKIPLSRACSLHICCFIWAF